MDKKDVKIGILYLLDTPRPEADEDTYTVEHIREFLKENNVKNYYEEDKDCWMRLKDLLREMAEEGLIEEMHIGFNGASRIDYSIQDAGMALVSTESRVELMDKWKLP